MPRKDAARLGLLPPLLVLQRRCRLEKILLQVVWLAQNALPRNRQVFPASVGDDFFNLGKEPLERKGWGQGRVLAGCRGG